MHTERREDSIMTPEEMNPSTGDEISYQLPIGTNNPLWLLVPLVTFAGVRFLASREATTWMMWGIFLAGVVTLYGLASMAEMKVASTEA